MFSITACTGAISKETRLLCRYRIDTTEQLFSLKEDPQGRMAGLADKRKHLRYQSRSVKDSEKLSEVKTEISALTKQIGELRKEVGLCDGIAARSGAKREGFRIWAISVVPPLAGQGAKDSIAGIISSFLLKTVYRISAGTIYAAHTVLFC